MRSCSLYAPDISPEIHRDRVREPANIGSRFEPLRTVLLGFSLLAALLLLLLLTVGRRRGCRSRSADAATVCVLRRGAAMLLTLWRPQRRAAPLGALPLLRMLKLPWATQVQRPWC